MTPVVQLLALLLTAGASAAPSALAPAAGTKLAVVTLDTSDARRVAQVNLCIGRVRGQHPRLAYSFIGGALADRVPTEFHWDAESLRLDGRASRMKRNLYEFSPGTTAQGGKSREVFADVLQCFEGTAPEFPRLTKLVGL